MGDDLAGMTFLEPWYRRRVCCSQSMHISGARLSRYRPSKPVYIQSASRYLKLFKLCFLRYALSSTAHSRCLGAGGECTYSRSVWHQQQHQQQENLTQVLRNSTTGAFLGHGGILPFKRYCLSLCFAQRFGSSKQKRKLCLTKDPPTSTFRDVQ